MRKKSENAKRRRLPGWNRNVRKREKAELERREKEREGTKGTRGKRTS